MERKYFWTYILIGGVTLLTLILLADGRLQGEDTGTPPAQSASGQSFSFQLEIEGRYTFYDECQGLGSSSEIEETLIPSANGVVRQKTPGALEWHNITLKKIGPSDPNGVPAWSWRKAMEDGDRSAAVRNGAITVWRANPPGGPLARWEFRNGWVAALSFDGSAEEMTIVHEGLERTDVINLVPGPRPRKQSP